MLRRLTKWFDLRRGLANLAGSLLGASIAAWSLQAPAVGVGFGLASVIVAFFVINAYRTPDRIEVQELGSRWSTESAVGNVHVLPSDDQ
jgi:hypothetical protein